MDYPEATLSTIGQAADQAGVAPSTLRYYERRGLLAPDARISGQRRYGAESIRRLAFIGMLQEAGLSLDEIDGVINATSVEQWKSIARGRLTVLDEQISRLTRARTYLSAALLCRSAHPLTECTIIGREIDHRLGNALPVGEHPPAGPGRVSVT